MKKISLLVAALFAFGVAMAQTSTPPQGDQGKQKPETHGQNVSGTAHQTPSGPGKGAAVSEAAKDNNGQANKAEKKAGGAKHKGGAKHAGGHNHAGGDKHAGGEMK